MDHNIHCRHIYMDVKNMDIIRPFINMYTISFESSGNDANDQKYELFYTIWIHSKLLIRPTT